MRNLSLFCVGIASLGACKWTEFDDLKSEAWVSATAKPDNGSTNWGVAIARGARAGDPAKLAVVGTAESLYNEIELRPDGGSKIAGNEQKLNAQFGIGNLEAQPILLADPTSDDIALVTKSGASQVVVLRGTSGDLNPHQIFGPDTADAATFMVAPGVDASPTPQPAQPLVASGDRVFGTFYTPPEQPFVQPKCALKDAALAPVQVRALGTVRLAPTDPTDDVVVWSSTGDLFIYSGGIFDGARSATACPDGNLSDTDNTGTSAPGALLAGPLAVGFNPGIGSQIHVFGGHFAILVGHDDTNTRGFLAMVDLALNTAGPTVNTKLVGSPQSQDGLRAAALFNLAADDAKTIHIVAGYPTFVVDGVSAGQALVFDVNTDTGIAATASDTLHDAQPEDSTQSFGRAVAVLPYNGQSILAIAANNEVFVYFRTNKYDDTREGR